MPKHKDLFFSGILTCLEYYRGVQNLVSNRYRKHKLAVNYLYTAETKYKIMIFYVVFYGQLPYFLRRFKNAVGNSIHSSI